MRFLTLTSFVSHDDHCGDWSHALRVENADGEEVLGVGGQVPENILRSFRLRQLNPHLHTVGVGGQVPENIPPNFRLRQLNPHLHTVGVGGQVPENVLCI